MPSPTTPWTSEAIPTGTAGAFSAKRARRPLGSWVSTKVTLNVPAIWSTVPVTGMRRPSGDVGPGRSPVEANQARTAPMAAGVGPKVEANWPGAR